MFVECGVGGREKEREREGGGDHIHSIKIHHITSDRISFFITLFSSSITISEEGSVWPLSSSHAMSCAMSWLFLPLLLQPSLF